MIKKYVNMRNSDKILLAVCKLIVIACIALLLPIEQVSAQRRPANRPTARPTPSKPATANTGGRNVAGAPGKANNVNAGNKANINNSKKNVNINIDNSKDIHINNSRNTAVRRNTRVYARPPYVYGGHRYRCYHPYYFHPYRPFVWGPVWHPWGFFVATLAATAIIVSVADNDMPHPADLAWNNFTGIGVNPIDKQLMSSSPSFVSYTDHPVFSFSQASSASQAAATQYYYDQGVFYVKSGEGYSVVAAPVGAKVKSLPSGYETVVIDEKTTNYYYGGAFYEKRSDGYVVVAPMAGAVVEHISEGGEEVKMGEQTYVKFGETYFQPIQENGKNMYEVADVEEDK